MRVSRQANLDRARRIVEENYDLLCPSPLRTVTMGFNTFDCIDADIGRMTDSVNARLGVELTAFQTAITQAIEAVFGSLHDKDGHPWLQTRRATVTPLETMTRAAVVSGGCAPADIVSFAQAIDSKVRSCLGQDEHGEPKAGECVFLGGAGLLADRGLSAERDTYLEALKLMLVPTKNPDQTWSGPPTEIFNVNITVGSTQSGIHLDSVRAAAKIIREVGKVDIEYTTWKYEHLTPEEKAEVERIKEQIMLKWPYTNVSPFFSNLARLAVFVNAPQENPFMAGGFAGLEAPARTISVGINGAGVIQKAILAAGSNSMNDIIASIRYYAGQLYEVAEAVRFEVIARMNDQAVKINEADGVVDLSVASTPDRDSQGNPTNSIAAALSALGVEAGAHGSIAAVGAIIDNLKKIGSGTVTYAGGLSGTFIPVSEDAGMADAVASKWLTFPRFLCMTSVCSVGTDMFIAYWPQDMTDANFEAQIAGMLLDEMAIGVYTNKTTSCRIVPVQFMPPESYWFVVLMGGAGLLGYAPVMDLGFDALPAPTTLVGREGSLPAPITSFRN